MEKYQMFILFLSVMIEVAQLITPYLLWCYLSSNY